MKFNKYSINHYFIFIWSLLLLLIAVPVRYVKISPNKKTVILYGHKLYGNLKAIYDSKSQINSSIYFLTLDKNYYQNLAKKNVNVIYGLNLIHVIKVVKSTVFVCDHGLHFYKILMYLSNIVFLDTNHGVTHNKDGLKFYNYFSKFDEVWMMSKYQKKLYEEYDYKSNNLVITGYGRLDSLFEFTNKDKGGKVKIINNLKEKYEIKSKKVVLLAPTWVKKIEILDNENYPYNKIKFFEQLENIGAKENLLFIYRPHMNDIISNEIYTFIQKSKFIVLRDLKTYTNTEDFLKMCDILITDWSSIALDYIILNRPVLFLDTLVPFVNGVHDENVLRYGEVVKVQKLNEVLSLYVRNKELYFENNPQHLKIKNVFHDIGLDGKSTERYIGRINNYLS